MADKNNKTTNPCARCIWRMCNSERVICSLPRCVNPTQCKRQKYKLGPGGCWTYQRPLKRSRRKLPQEGPLMTNPRYANGVCAESTGHG